MTDTIEVPIRRRTPGERAAYLQGYVAAIRLGLECARHAADVRKKLDAHLRFQQMALDEALKALR